MNQLELFDNIEKHNRFSEQKKPDEAANQFFKYKKTLFVFLYSLLIFFIGFTIGSSKAKEGLPEAKVTVALPALKESVKQEPSFKQTEVAKSVQAIEEKTTTSATVNEKKGFVIQVASYKTESTANKERADLEKRGLKAFISNSGNYVAVLVGPFAAKESAQKHQKQLKAKYKDCFLKKL